MLLLSLFSAFVSSRQHRVLAVLDNIDDASLYSQFFSDLASIGCTVTYKSKNTRRINLERFGQKVYDTVVIMCGKTNCFGNNAEELFDFIDNGGNAFVFENALNPELDEKIYRHLNLRVMNGNKIRDILGNKRVVLRKILAPENIVSKGINPLVYEGGFSIIDRPNDFRFPIVVGGLEHKTSQQERIGVSQILANDLIPIAAFQARTGGRVVIIHSSNFATDMMFNELVKYSETMKELETPIQNGNRQLLEQLSEWVTHYKNHVKIVEATHYDAESKETPVQYHIKQNITVDVKLQYTNKGEWMDYTEEDVQVEIFMLGVFIRRHMKLVEPGHYKETLVLPDRAGNYKIKVFTSKEGWMNAREEMAIAIRPLSIREKEKFLFCAEPYQLSMILIMAASFLASIHFLYHKPSNQ